MARTWPEDWEARRAGEGCPFCVESAQRAERKFFSGRVSDAYLQKSGPSRGYSIVVFRGRHVADLTELTGAELIGFWIEVRVAARFIKQVFEPAHLNYDVLGNIVPHVHAHIVPRYLDDAAPEAPLPFDDHPVDAEEFERQLDSLRQAAGRTFTFPFLHAGLTADMFVIRDGKFLVLTRGGGVGEGVEYIPGGLVDRGEDPMDAAIRETKEETGLDLRDVRQLRVWSYDTPDGWETVHTTFVGYSDQGDVVITPEHTAHRWVTPSEHVARWCPEGAEESFPQFSTWFPQVRRNCSLISELLELDADGRPQ